MRAVHKAPAQFRPPRPLGEGIGVRVIAMTKKQINASEPETQAQETCPALTESFIIENRYQIKATHLLEGQREPKPLTPSYRCQPCLILIT